MAENDQSLRRSALVVTVLFLIGGLYIFFKDIAYQESGHLALGGAYALLCVLFYFFFKNWKIILTGITVLLMVFCLVLIVQKYEWRKNYVDAATPFFMEEYIDSYPSFEEYLKISYFGGENWVGFSKDCAEPAMLGQTPPIACQSIASVKTNYGIDLKNTVSKAFKKMQATARKVERGQLKTAIQYKNCIENKSCAAIPMLPKGVNADNISPNSNKYADIRTAYWALIEEKAITTPVCEYMKICKVMVKLGIIDPNNFKL